MTVKSKSKHHGTPVEAASASIDGDRLAALRAIVPEAFGEAGIDFEKLKLALGGSVDEDAGAKERYGLSWSGKAQSARQLMLPSRATLVPDVKKSVNFDATRHVFIEGENLEVLKLLRKAYAGRVKMIYIDPPYNTGKDFIYPDNFTEPLSEYLKKTGQVDDKGNRIGSISIESDGRKHSKWLSMIYPRLLAARDLLREDGVIFVSIDDHEVHNLRMVMNEVFGEENFIGVMKRRAARKTAHLSEGMADTCDYVVVYARHRPAAPMLSVGTVGDLTRPVLNDGNKIVERTIPAGREARCEDGAYPAGTRRGKTLEYEYLDPLIVKDGKVKKAVRVRGPFRVNQQLLNDTVYVTVNGGLRRYITETESKDAKVINDLVDDPQFYNENGGEELASLIGGKAFTNPKPVALIEYLIKAVSTEDPGGIVLDFFAGSGTTGHAVYRRIASGASGLRFVLVQLDEPVRSSEHDDASRYRDLAEVTRARLVASGKREQAAGESLTSDTNRAGSDWGFRAFRIAGSHYKRWAGVTEQDAENYIETTAADADALLDGWTAEGLLWEVSLKAGYPLHSTIEILKEIKGQTVYRVSDPDKGTSFLACFDKSIARNIAARLKLTREDTFVVRGVALDDTLAANLAFTCTLKTI